MSVCFVCEKWGPPNDGSACPNFGCTSTQDCNCGAVEGNCYTRHEANQTGHAITCPVFKRWAAKNLTGGPMNKVYIAAPIFNKEQLAVVSSITMMLKLHECEYFSPYEASQAVWKGRAPKDCSQEERNQVLRGNIENLDWADILLAWVGGTEDGRTDTGVTWEMGHFNALKRYGGIDPSQLRFTLVYIDPSDKRQHMNLMLAGTVDAVAYGPAQLDRAIRVLRYGDVNSVREQFDPDKNLLHEKEPIS